MYTKNDELDFLSPLEVKVQNDNVDKAIRIFKTLVQKEGILLEYKQRQHYESPSEKRRRKEREAARRKYAAELRERLIASGEWEARQNAREAKRAARAEGRKAKQVESNE